MTTYNILLNQTETNNPIATVLENTTGLEITWVRNGIGGFRATSNIPGSLPKDNRMVFIGSLKYFDGINLLFEETDYEYSDDFVSFQGFDNNHNPADGLTNLSIEIRVYN